MNETLDKALATVNVTELPAQGEHRLTWDEVVHRLNPAWKRCQDCGGFHPVDSEC